MDWFLKLEHKGRDLYPVLRDVFERPEYYKSEKVRAEVFRHFGYFMTETTGHLSEYVPWFRKNKEAMDLYCDEPGFGEQLHKEQGFLRLASLLSASLSFCAGLDCPPRHKFKFFSDSWH